MSETHDWKDDPRLVAYALGEWSQLSASDVAEIEEALGGDGDPLCREALGELQDLIPDIEQALRPGRAAGPRAAGPELAAEARARIALAARRGAPSSGMGIPALAAAALALVAGGLAWQLGSGPARVDQVAEGEVARADPSQAPGAPAGGLSGGRTVGLGGGLGQGKGDGSPDGRGAATVTPKAKAPGADVPVDPAPRKTAPPELLAGSPSAPEDSVSFRKKLDAGAVSGSTLEQLQAPPRIAAASAVERPSPERARGRIAGAVAKEKAVDVSVRTRNDLDGPDRESESRAQDESGAWGEAPPPENPFVDAAMDPFSTFSIDVDTASYASARAAIQAGSRPARESIRVEEFINYFTYADEGPRPGDTRPFAVHVDVGAAPWAPDHRLVRIGLKARSVEFAQRKHINLVFLVDVSGSMSRANKLPLVKKALAILTESLHPEDRVAIAVYASARGLALDSTPVAAREAILQSLERLAEGGSTDGGAGIQLAYSVAREHFVEGGVNRVVLCTDGDFNVGITGKGELEELIAREARSGVELTVLGFGGASVSGDGRMEALSNRGNGNYAMIDSELEARKVLASEVGGTLLTVAKDVKVQVAWNPELVGAFRLIGYENRMLAHADFLDDRKDAGEIGAGHGVTALYEVVPAGGADLAGRREVEAPRAPGGTETAAVEAFEGDGLLEVRLRYKEPGSEASVGFGVQASDGGANFNGATEDLRFAASVAAFAMIMRGSEAVGDLTLADVRGWSLESKGADPGGLREGFVRLVERMIDREKASEPFIVR